MDPHQTPNPYAAPAASVLTPQSDEEAQLIRGGRSVSAGRGAAWVAAGWQIFTQSAMMWVLNVVIIFALVIVLNMLPVVGALAGNFLLTVCSAGVSLAAHRAIVGRPVEVGDVFTGFSMPNARSAITVGVLYTVSFLCLTIVVFALLVGFVGVGMSFAAFMSGGGEELLVRLFGGAALGILLVVLIWLALWVPLAMAFWFAPALTAIGGQGPSEAIRNSFMGCLRNIFPFLLYGLVMALLLTVSLIPFGLGLLITVPLLFTSSYAAFREIYLGKTVNDSI
jgi:uncharacterized membrane protein